MDSKTHEALLTQVAKVDELVQMIGAWISREQEVTLRRKWVVANAGEDLQIPNFPPLTLYVDNSANAAAVTIQLDGDIGVFTVAANGSLFIPCEGMRSALVSGTGQTKILFVNRLWGFN